MPALCFLYLYIDIKLNRAVVRAVNFGMNFRVNQLFSQSFGGYEIVNSPSDISLSCLHTVTPPRISVFQIRIKMTECINKSAVENCCHLFSFLGCKSGVLSVRFRVFQVNFLMGNIQIAAVNNGLFLIKLKHIFSEQIFPAHTLF